MATVTFPKTSMVSWDLEILLSELGGGARAPCRSDPECIFRIEEGHLRGSRYRQLTRVYREEGAPHLEFLPSQERLQKPTLPYRTNLGFFIIAFSRCLTESGLRFKRVQVTVVRKTWQLIVHI